MEANREIVYYLSQLDTDFKWLELYYLSDLHYGNPFCDAKRWLRGLDYIRDTAQAHVVLTGDLCESSLRTSKGEIYKQVGTPQDQRDWNIEKLYPIRHKILGMCSGNHEDRIFNEVGIDITKDIAEALGVPYDPDGMYLKVSFGDRNNWTQGRPFVYYSDSSHGYGGARTKAAKAVKVERQSTWLHADITTMSHDHVVNAAPDIFLMPDNRTTPQRKDGKLTGFRTGKVVAHRKSLVKTNAFLKWGGYARKGGFPPSDLITPIIWLGGEEKPWPGPKSPSMELRKEVRVVV